MMEYIVRGFLCLHGLMLCNQGASYINTPRNKVLVGMLKKEGLDGPGLNIIVPFLGISYVTVGGFNLLAFVVFSYSEACYILIGSGLIFHIGMATVRAKLDVQTADLYQAGMVRKTNMMQYGIGIICCTLGTIGSF